MEGETYWWKSAKIYELYIDKFAGDLKGLTQKLDYFTELGVDCLHLLPHYPSPMVDGGYDVADYRGVRPELGTLDDFKILVEQAHTKNICIIIDFVLNHTSEAHPWFVEARASKHNPKRDYYLWSECGTEFANAINAFPDIKPGNWIYNEQTSDYYFATFYPQQPDLNWNNPQIVQEMLTIIDFWVNLGVDGFRLDAVPHLIKRGDTTCKGLPEVHAILKKIRTHIEARWPEVVLLAEAHEALEDTKKYFGVGDECHLVYHFPLMEQMWMALMFGEPERVRAMIEQSFAGIPAQCQWVTFLRNHDEISLTLLQQKERERLVEALYPTYQYLFKKARTTSMRLAEALGGDSEKILKALEMLYKSPGAPVMYYGDEIGMQNLPTQDTVIDTRSYVRGTFDWQEARKQMYDPASLWNNVVKIIKRPHPNFW